MQNAKTAVRCLFTFLFLFSALPVFGADKAKDDATFRNAATVLEEMLEKKSVPEDLLARADCVIVLPGVKKMAFGVGGSGGRGPMTCRTGNNFSGKWSAPAMFSIGGASAGFQVGGSSTDFVLLVMSQSAVDALLKGKTKVGNDVTAAAGPGATTGSSVGGAGILTYGRAKGLFAGVSLSGATLDSDNDANKRLYGKALSARDIVRGNTAVVTTGGESLVSLLNAKVPKHKM
ncbi:MAG: hypothetical protein CXZ00_04775 [Acidobacteria bacterium]|nr:MAG: hypothetical protein CXZ00_04775 [Acidobacteriota bacterium]